MRQVAEALAEGDMVVCRRTGNIGLLAELAITHECSIMIANNVYARACWRDLRLATLREISEAGLDGVGRRRP